MGRHPPLATLGLGLWLALAGSGPTPVGADEWERVPRRILAFYDSTEGQASDDNDVQETLALPLWHLGQRVDFQDAAAPALPDATAMEPYRGLIVYTHQLECRPALRRFVIDQVTAGRRLLLLTALSPDQGEGKKPPCEEADEVVNELMGRLGLVTSSAFTHEGAEGRTRFKHVEASWFGFERPVPTGNAPFYELTRSTGEGNRSLLSVWIEGLEGSVADLVVLGPFGAYAVEEYLCGVPPGGSEARWGVDPFRFLEAVFGLEGLPRLDPNVLGGRRVLLAHVDGDAFNSYSYDRPSQICGKILLDEVLADPEYQDIPHTVSLISAEIDPESGHMEPESREAARAIFALEHVEAASHAFTHPMDWREGTLAFEDVELGGEPYRFDRVKETVGSLEAIAALAPKDRPPRVMLWSGSCNPDEATLALLEERGYLNMNGGDPRLDEAQPSWTGVAPPVFWVGGRARFSSGAANDYLLTDEWTPPFTGFSNIVETFRRTANPRPVTPVDVYYHFYIVEREVALASLKRVLNWCQRHPAGFARLFVSEYLEMMKDLLGAELFRAGDRFKVWTAGRLRTVRFDATTRVPDLASARGVLGYAQRWGSLYVHLDQATEHEFRLVDAPPARGAGLRPHLRESSRPLAAVPLRDGELFAFEGSGPAATTLVLAGLEPGAYVAWEVEGGATGGLATGVERADAEGTLTIAARLGRAAGGHPARIGGRPSTAAAYAYARQLAWFDVQGRYLALTLGLALLGWTMCRFHRPLLPPPLVVARPDPAETAELDAVVSVEVEAPRGGVGGPEPSTGNLPAGGDGPWGPGAA